MTFKPGFTLRMAAAAFALAAAAGVRGAGLSDSVVILANSYDPDSLAIARHYAQVRSVPAANLIALRMSTEETITWREFVATIWQPLEDELVRRGWIDAIGMNLVDEVGRRKYAIFGHRIAALVVCRGVPLKVAHDPALYADVMPYTAHPEFRTNQGAVDSELSLLAQTDYPINASVPNPLFLDPRPSAVELARVVKVSRLDGPTAAEANGLVDLAVEAERTGLLGRAYVDIAGPHDRANRWLGSVAEEIRALGFDTTVGRGPGTFPESSRIDAPVLYFGWYTQDLNGPFTLPGLRFPPGAVAVHIHSYSAQTLRSATEGWCGPLVSRGVTATVGNVYEPYLEDLHRPDLMLDALVRGEDLVDAAYYALPVLSWQSIVIGDPLYRPFSVGLSEQLGRISALPPGLAGYAVIRRMNLDDAQGRPADAIAEGRAGLKKVPSLALALAVAQRLAASGNREAATWMVRDAVDSMPASAETWEVEREAAVLLAACGRTGEAIGVYRKLFESDGLPAGALSSWMAEARQVALASGDTAQAAEWEEELTRNAQRRIGGARQPDGGP
jgi:uncharacterized protein (TIGR03790 family)